MVVDGKKEYADPGWSAWETVAVLGLSMLLSAIPYRFAGAARGIGADLIAYFVQTGCFLLLPLLLATVLRSRSPADLGFTVLEWRRCLIVGVGFGLLLYLVNLLITWCQSLIFPQAQAQEYIVDLLDKATPFETAFLLLLLLFMAPLAEETLFRGFFFPALRWRYGRAAAYIITAAVFAASHMSLWTLLPVVCVSLGLCRLYEKFGSLWYNIIAHITWNAVALTLYYLT